MCRARCCKASSPLLLHDGVGQFPLSVLRMKRVRVLPLRPLASVHCAWQARPANRARRASGGGGWRLQCEESLMDYWGFSRWRLMGSEARRAAMF
jgi:hypothetical protein